MVVPLAGAGLHFILFFGSVRDPRNADRVVPFVLQALEKRNVTVTIFDARELQLDEVVKPIQYYGKDESPPEKLLKLNSQIKNADGFVVMTAEYHGQIAPGLLNLMNQFPPNAYAFRPAGIVSYSKEDNLTLGKRISKKLGTVNGHYGGIRAAMELRSYLSDLGMVQVPAIFSVPKVEDVLTPEGTTEIEYYHTSVNGMIEQLVWFAEAVKIQRASKGYRCTDCFDDMNLGTKGLPYKNKKWV